MQTFPCLAAIVSINYNLSSVVCSRQKQVETPANLTAHSGQRWATPWDRSSAQNCEAMQTDSAVYSFRLATP